MDFATGKVSNQFIIIGLVLGFILQIILKGKSGIIPCIVGTIVPILVLMLVFMIGGIGAGDIKLFSVIGVFIGYQGVFTCIIASFVIGAFISIGKILINHNFLVCFNNIIRSFSQLYYSQTLPVYKREKSNTIHFTLPILISVIFYTGGII